MLNEIYKKLLSSVNSSPTGNITYGAPQVPFSGVVPPGTREQMLRYSAITPDMASVYGNPNPSWLDKLKAGYNDIDKDFLLAALGSIGNMGRQPMSGGGGGGGGFRGGGGGNIQPAGLLSAALPNIPPQAPNPGFYLNLPRQQKDRYSGGF